VYSRGTAGLQNTVNSSFCEKSPHCCLSKMYITNRTYIIMIYLAREWRVESKNSDGLHPYNIILLLYIMTRSFHTLKCRYLLHGDDDRELYPAHLRELVSRHIFTMFTFQKTTKSIHSNKLCGIYVYTAAHYCVSYF